MSLLKKQSPSKTTKLTGTYEWMPTTFNSQKGCVNNCKYCYAKKVIAPRFKLMPANGWEHPEYRSKEWIVKKLRSKKYQETTGIMYPSIHDFTPDNIDLCCFTIESMLRLTKADLLLVSKPDPKCIRQIVDLLERLYPYRPHERIEFRLTIGSNNPKALKEWEPDAPPLEERLTALGLVTDEEYSHSISMEPLLETKIVELNKTIDFFSEYLPCSIWIGGMNYIQDAPQYNYKTIYNGLKHKPLLKWKESFRKHLPGEFNGS